MSSKREPIIDFKDTEELMRCLKEWQKILYLEDWIIKGTLLTRSELRELSGEDLSGRNEFTLEAKAAHIYVCKADDDVLHRVVKFCAEQTLVHELLHCKYNWLSPPQTLEAKYFDAKEHQSLEMMARSLIMAKYSLTKEWFSNIEYAL